ncbi:MAG: hypothetical protein ACRD6W_05960, partial [Nitrososphaerales archaeon]
LAPLGTTTAFDGNEATITATVALKDLYTLLDSVTVQTGAPGIDFSADIQAIVHIKGSLGGEHVDTVFSPTLPFSVSQDAVTLDVSAAPAPPGATYALPSASAELASTVNPSQVGTIPHVAPNVVSVAKYDLAVPTLRILGILFASLALILGLVHDQLRRRRTRKSDEELIAKRLRTPLVPIVTLPASEFGLPIDVPGFAHLANLAKFLERPILYEMVNGSRTYAVDDDTRRYIYRPCDVAASSPASTEGEVQRASLPVVASAPPAVHHRRRQRVFARGAAALMSVVVIATVGVSFTASTSVPASKAGSSAQARTVSELAPAGCARLSLTSLVTGSG